MAAARRTRAPFISLWARDDVRTAIVDFLPTKTIAVLPCVVKPLRAAQSQLLVTAIRRRGKTAVPRPSTTRALLDALLVGEPQHFCEKWERGLEQWEDHAPDKYPVHISRPPEGDRYLNLIRMDSEDHSGFARRIRGENLLVTRLQVTMSYVECAPAGAVGYVMFCNPGDQRWDVAMGGPRFDSDYVGGGAPITLKDTAPLHLGSEITCQEHGDVRAYIVTPTHDQFLLPLAVNGRRLRFPSRGTSPDGDDYLRQ